MSKAGMALLFRSCGGTPTQPMLDIIEKQESNGTLAERLIKEARKKWDKLDAKESGDAKGVSLSARGKLGLKPVNF